MSTTTRTFDEEVKRRLMAKPPAAPVLKPSSPGPSEAEPRCTPQGGEGCDRQCDWCRLQARRGTVHTAPNRADVEAALEGRRATARRVQLQGQLPALKPGEQLVIIRNERGDDQEVIVRNPEGSSTVSEKSPTHSKEPSHEPEAPNHRHPDVGRNATIVDAPSCGNVIYPKIIDALALAIAEASAAQAADAALATLLNAP